MGREEAVDETHLVDDEEAEGETQNTGCDRESAVKPVPAVARVVEGGGHSESDEHHAGDGAYSEEEEVGDGPVRVVKGGQDQERDCS